MKYYELIVRRISIFMNNLRYYQKKAVEAIIEFYNSDVKNAKIMISNGLGSTKILTSSIEEILTRNKNCKILLLCFYKETSKQYIRELMACDKALNVVSYLPHIKNNGIFITNYQENLTQTNPINYNQFDFIICDNIEFLRQEGGTYPFFDKTYKGKRLTLVKDKENELIKNDKLIFKYDFSQAIKDGGYTAIKETSFIDDFFISLLNSFKFKNINIEAIHKKFRTDVEADYNNKHYIFEIKMYRTKYASASLIEHAAYIFGGIIENIKIENCKPVMVVTCKVDKELKQKIFNETKIEIWDISNLISLCMNSQTLMQKLLLYISFPIFDIEPEETTLYNNEKNTITKPKYENNYQKFEDLFSKCKPGKEDDMKYEEICTEVIKYLFETEFFQMSNQHKTGDELFRMDLICSLKGTTEFWKFLMQFFNTKFVVFEYKNYVEKISQNLVFITSKYLYPSALRNVAFIISRNGLNANAEIVVNAKIKNEKTLIISLTDEDILIMVALKDEGKEPSDYLLEKVENLLMSLSI